MTRQQRIDRAKRVQKQHAELRSYPRCSQDRLAHRRGAIGLLVLAALCFAGSMVAKGTTAPTFALAAFIFLVAAVIVAVDA